MKNIKNVVKIAAAVIFMLAMNASVQAQNYEKTDAKKNRQERKEMAMKRFDELATRLALSDEQKAKFKTIAEQNREELKAKREEIKQASPEKRREMVMVQMKKANEQINAILNDKQKEEFKKYKEEKRAERMKKKAEQQEQKEMPEDEGLF
jgi:Spy/CpxP family protein refolding chaperone